MDTIASLQTPPGRGGIAVILLAGPSAAAICDKAFRPLPSHADGGPSMLQLGHVVAGDRPIDEAIVHQRDDCIEINIHGGPQAAKAALERLAELGARVVPIAPAADESFDTTHPKWHNPAIGREMLELLPAAASTLVVAAVTGQWSGGISRLARTAIDELDRQPDASALARIAGELAAAADDQKFATMTRLIEPPQVVLVGPPNAGKSALTNALVGRPVSIVHETPGTTRDWVRELALLDGVPVWLTDTAGIWDLSPGASTPPPPGDAAAVDAEAVRRARHRAESADLVLMLSPGEPIDTPGWLHATALLRVVTKTDLAPPSPGADAAVSAATGDGLDDLQCAILRKLGLAGVDPATPAAFTQRQVDLLKIAADALLRRQPRDARQLLRALLEENTQ